LYILYLYFQFFYILMFCYIFYSLFVVPMSIIVYLLVYIYNSKKKNIVLPEPPSGLLTLVFVDVSGSTVLWEKCSDAMCIAINTYYDILHKYSEMYDGYEVNTEGDSMFVVFNNIINALVWCIEIDMELLKTKWPDELLNHQEAAMIKDENGNIVFNGLTIHIGLHVGEPICQYNKTKNHFDYLGPSVNKAARIQTLACRGQILSSSLYVFTLIDTLHRFSSNDIISNDVNNYEINIGKHKITIKYIGIYSLKNISIPERIYQIIHEDMQPRYSYRTLSGINTVNSEGSSSKQSPQNDKTNESFSKSLSQKNQSQIYRIVREPIRDIPVLKSSSN